MFLWNKHVAAVSAQMMTWEVTTAFDGELTETELQKRFDDDFGNLLEKRNGECRETCDTDLLASRVFFWPLVSFNASDGRKHRYLVAIAEEPLEKYRKKFDRCLPQQIALFSIADKILRGAWDEAAEGLNLGENVKWNLADDLIADSCEANETVANNGNLVLVALWKNVLYILVFAKGRLCHWSEEFGYGNRFDELIAERVSRFKSFLKSDELFADEGAFSETFICCDDMSNMEKLFCESADDPFWRGLDLDNCDSLKPCAKRRWFFVAFLLFMLCMLNVLWLKNPFACNAEMYEPHKDVAAVELDLPSDDVLNKLAWAKGHGLLLAGGEGLSEKPSSWSSCNSLDYKLVGIVGGRVALMKSATGGSRTVSVGDSLFRYRVKEIGRNEVVLRCGGKEVRYEVGSPIISPIVSHAAVR